MKISSENYELVHSGVVLQILVLQDCYGCKDIECII